MVQKDMISIINTTRPTPVIISVLFKHLWTMSGGIGLVPEENQIIFMTNPELLEFQRIDM